MTHITANIRQRSFIDEDVLFDTLAVNRNPEQKLVVDIVEKARLMEGLSISETAALLQNTDREMDALMFSAARDIKLAIYGKRMVLFAPLYVSNECSNSCAYCGFAATNAELNRKTLSLDEIRQEVQILEERGHKRLLLVYGEHTRFDADWYVDTINAVYETRSGKSGEIRRVNVNLAPLDVNGFKKLRTSGIGTYQCFQETYHHETYRKVHLGGRKTDFLWRLFALHRAQEAGIDDVAMGVLFGLYDYKFEVLALLAHAAELEREFGVGPHTISFPRIEPALGAPLSFQPPYAVDDYDFMKLVAILRLAVPYTGLILTTRETADYRRELLRLGVSQLSAGSRTYPGAYQEAEANLPSKQQFTIGDTRSLDEVIYDIVTNLGYIPSFCTGCYRLGRTGDHFMGLAKSAFIHNYCWPNALLTFKEYLMDYATEATRDAGNKLIENELATITHTEIKNKLTEGLVRIEAGDRDLFW
ncbi:[FeFe] hydrogenase H-cluster radical SAM maturase HydG [bacterium]|nr:[FeFe] hydrogenase H-cluster radical SAM maturase HydG [candidate division CSSED10-310 bacterium]